MLQPRESQYPFHSFGFRFSYGFAQLGQTIVAAALIIEAEIRTLGGFLDHLVIQKSPYDPVQRARAQPDLVVSPARNLFADDVTVLLAIRERQQDMEQRRS